MMAINDVRLWLSELADDSSVAIDDGGLNLVEIGNDGKETGYYLEVGGTPKASGVLMPMRMT